MVSFEHSSIAAPAARQRQVIFTPGGHGGGSTSQPSCWWTLCAVISPNGEFWFQVQVLQAKQRGGQRALLSSQRRVVLLVTVCCHNSAVFTSESPGDGGRHLLQRCLDLLDGNPSDGRCYIVGPVHSSHLKRPFMKSHITVVGLGASLLIELGQDASRCPKKLTFVRKERKEPCNTGSSSIW